MCQTITANPQQKNTCTGGLFVQEVVGYRGNLVYTYIEVDRTTSRPQFSTCVYNYTSQHCVSLVLFG